MDINNLCYGCMREKENADEICPYCGFDRFSYEKIRSTRALPLGTILNGKYFLGKVLGEGGFGITYLAMDLNFEIPVAVKEYFPVGLASRDTSIEGNTENISVITGEKKKYYDYGIQSFSAEAKNLAKFQRTDGIIAVKDFFLENSTAYLVMEYIDGKTLKQYLEEKDAPLSEEETLRLIRPILNALQKIHEEGIIHRDISPENIMLAKDGRVVLIDFGAARISTGAETKSLTVLLKNGYAPVEQYQTQGKQGPYTDIYAICATMYRMMSGEKPQEAIDRMVEDKVVRLEIKSGLHISHIVSAVVQKGLAVQAKDRFQTVKELKEKLFGEEENNVSPTEADIKPSINGKRMDQNDKQVVVIQTLKVVFLVIAVLFCLGGISLWKKSARDIPEPTEKAVAEENNLKKTEVVKKEEIIEEDTENSKEEIKKIYQPQNIEVEDDSNCVLTQNKVIEILNVESTGDLIRLLEDNCNIHFYGENGYWVYCKDSTYIFIEGELGNPLTRISWEDFPYLACKGVANDMNRKQVEDNLGYGHAVATSSIYYEMPIVTNGIKDTARLSVEYDRSDKEGRVKALCFNTLESENINKIKEQERINQNANLKQENRVEVLDIKMAEVLVDLVEYKFNITFEKQGTLGNRTWIYAKNGICVVRENTDHTLKSAFWAILPFLSYRNITVGTEPQQVETILKYDKKYRKKYGEIFTFHIVDSPENHLILNYDDEKAKFLYYFEEA